MPFCVVLNQTHLPGYVTDFDKFKVMRELYNRPFYSCVLSGLAWIESEAGVDLVLIETSLLFLCK